MSRARSTPTVAIETLNFPTLAISSAWINKLTTSASVRVRHEQSRDHSEEHQGAGGPPGHGAVGGGLARHGVVGNVDRRHHRVADDERRTDPSALNGIDRAAWHRPRLAHARRGDDGAVGRHQGRRRANGFQVGGRGTGPGAGGRLDGVVEDDDVGPRRLAQSKMPHKDNPQTSHGRKREE